MTRELIHQVGELPVADQFAVLDWLQQNLCMLDQRASAFDQGLAEHSAALREIRRVAVKLGMTSGEWPTTRVFDEHAVEGWNCKRVSKVCGRWQVAINELNGIRPPATPEQRKNRRTIAGRDFKYAGTLQSVREWLATDPKVRDRESYDCWARRTNEITDGDRRRPTSWRVVEELGVPWREAVRVAAREITLDEAERSQPRDKPTYSPFHDFVPCDEIARMLELDRQQVRRLQNNRAFPVPVLIIGRTKVWLRTDIEAFKDGQPVPRREHNEMRTLYYNSKELAELLKVTPAALRQPKARAPLPDGAICGAHIWYRQTADQWLIDNPPTPHSGRRRNAHRSAATNT